MAAIDPVVLVAGTIREVNKAEFVDRSTGLVEDRGRRVTVLTRAGFLQFSAPPQFKEVIFREGEPVALWLNSREWSFNGRTGHSFIFESLADPDLAVAVVGKQSQAAK